MRIFFALTVFQFYMTAKGIDLSLDENCHSERKLCSLQCKPSTTYIVNTTALVPRICHQGAKSHVDCVGNRCPDDKGTICTRKKSKQVACKRGCREELVITRECHSPDECGDLIQGGCAARGETAIYAPGKCEPCADSFLNVTLRSALSSEDRTAVSRKWSLVLPFSDDKPAVRNLRCFAGFFREQECNGVSEVCSMTTRTFDSVLCLMKVCNQCARISLFKVSRELDRYCRYLQRESCRRVGGFGMRRLGAKGFGLGGSVPGLVREALKEDQDSVCVDGCKRRVLGCGERKKVCHEEGDECSLVTKERYVCEGGTGRLCGSDLISDSAKVVVKKCRRRYCERRICE